MIRNSIPVIISSYIMKIYMGNFKNRKSKIIIIIKSSPKHS